MEMDGTCLSEGRCLDREILSIGYNSSQSNGDGRRGKHCEAVGRLGDEASGGEVSTEVPSRGKE